MKMRSENQDHNGITGASKQSLSASLMQGLMVLNGVLLTAAAFVLLNMFIHNMLQDEYKRVTGNTADLMVDGISGLEKSLDTVASLLMLAQNTDQDVLVDNIRNVTSGLSPFDQIIWIYESAPGTWQYKDIYIHPGVTVGSTYIVRPNPEFIKGLIGAEYFNSSNLHAVTDFPGMNAVPDERGLNAYSHPFALIEAVHAGDTGAGLVIGISRIGTVFGTDWLQVNSALSRLNIKDMHSGKAIYDLNRGHGDDAEYRSSQAKVFKVGDASWQLMLEFNKQKDTILLEAIPYLMIVFGVILTVIGVMYVRNNQKQRGTLTYMNQTLENKNSELEKEISERERLNRALRRAERENRAIIDAVSDIIFETNTKGEILFLNSTWRKITGFEPEQFKHHDLFNMLHPQDQDRQRKDFELLVKGHRQAYRTFTRLRTSDGTFRSVEMAMSMIRQDENKNMRVVGTFTDVEERRRAERALSEAEKKYRTIVENAAGGIYQLTPEGIYLSANIAMARILGYESREDVVRINADRAVYADGSARNQFKRELEETGFISNRETQVRRKDGSLIWINENARVVRDDTGSILYYEGSIEDITQRKQSEIVLRDAKIRSDLANRAKSEFLANMGHELRTPLNAIIGFSEILVKEVLGPLGQKAYGEYARDIHESGRSLLKIINDILDISRVEAGDRALNESIVDMRKVAASAIELMSAKAAAGQKTVHNMLRDLPPIIGEEVALKQVLLNLLSNAVKFTPPGGAITLTSEIDPDGNMRLSVTDTGIGLDEKEIEKALSPFGQVDNALDREKAGTGLGLSLVMSLMKLHGGRFELFSQKGMGTTATIILPAERIEVRKVAAPSAVKVERQF